MVIHLKFLAFVLHNLAFLDFLRNPSLRSLHKSYTSMQCPRKRRTACDAFLWARLTHRLTSFSDINGSALLSLSQKALHGHMLSCYNKFRFLGLCALGRPTTDM